MAFKGGVVLGTVSLNATGTGTTNIGATSNSGTISIGNTSSGAITIDCGTAGITVGATANAHTSTFGSINTTSATTVQSGSGALNVTSSGGALTINSSTGALSVSSDAAATTVNLATGAGAKTVTMGSTNTSSSLALRYGTSDFSLASATGNVMISQDTGEINYPLQSCFVANQPTDQTNATGNNALYTLGSGVALTIQVDQNSDMNTNGTFTAPVTGNYLMGSRFTISNVTIGTGFVQRISSAGSATVNYAYSFQRAAGTQNAGLTMVQLVPLVAGDTCTTSIQDSGEAGNTQTVNGSANRQSVFWGQLIS